MKIYTWIDIKNRLNISTNDTVKNDIYRNTEKYYYQYYTLNNPYIKFTKMDVDNIVDIIIRDAEFRLIWISRDGFFLH
jgi:hypothetical protein